jgi:TPR repeat protein
MKKVLACLLCLALGASAVAAADELTDADALFAKKAYPEALQKYTKLANAGNVVAQQHLGEMYFYGEAGGVDMDKAVLWWSKAAAKGNKVAIASLDLIKQRAARRQDLDYWITQYDGADLTSGPYHCPAPRFPPVSKVNEEIERYNTKMKAWEDCHNGLVKHLNATLPLTNSIPPDVAKLMTKDEMDKATAHLQEVSDNLSEETKVAGKLVLADYDVWRNATDAYVKEHNEIVSNAPKPDVDGKR